MVRVAIVEDDPVFTQQLRNYLQQYGLENGTSFQITAYTDGDEIVEKAGAEYKHYPHGHPDAVHGRHVRGGGRSAGLTRK